MKLDAAVLSADQVLNIPSTRTQQERKVRIVVRTRICRHCQRRVPLFRTLFKATFCNRAHERAYLKSMEGLALERLRVAAERLKIAMSQSLVKTVADPPGIA